MTAHHRQTHRNPVQATVVSVSKDQTTVKVSIDRIVADEKYGKRLHRSTYLMADANGISSLAVGAVVNLLPCKKLSKTKAWRIVSLSTKA